MTEFRPDTLYYGDNIEVLRDFPPECVDLVYLDPPFTAGDIVHGRQIDMPSQRSTSDFTKARAARERAQKLRLL